MYVCIMYVYMDLTTLVTNDNGQFTKSVDKR